MKTRKLLNQWMAATFIFIVAMIVARMVYTDSMRHIFLVWNIFLAWIPYALSAFFASIHKKQLWKQLFLFSSWLLFFPNALYIVTDLVHLQDNGTAPLWFDVLLLFSSSLLGLLLAFVSLFRAERFLQQKFSSARVMVIMPVILFLGSYGVYLGRFGRWNSWDVIHNPIQLGEDIARSVIYPFEHLQAWAVTVMFTLFFYLLYRFSKMIPLQSH